MCQYQIHRHVLLYLEIGLEIRQILTNIVYGSSFYGGGGGGSSEEGLALIEAIYKEDPNASIQMIDILEMEKDHNHIIVHITVLLSTHK